MKADELMIGDWVGYRPGWINEETNQVEYESGTGLLVRIDMLYYSHGEGLVQYNDGENDGTEAAEYELFPIPLTEEILAKNGFRYVEQDVLMRYAHYYLGKPHFCENMDLHIGTNKVGVYWLNYLRNTIDGLRYVHELQHAFRLCGIDKEIML